MSWITIVWSMNATVDAVLFWLHPLAHSEKLGLSCGCLLK
jgi:hypothetical protein